MEGSIFLAGSAQLGEGKNRRVGDLANGLGSKIKVFTHVVTRAVIDQRPPLRLAESAARNETDT